MIPGNRSGYHVLLSAPQVLPVQVINVPAGLGITGVDSRGVKVGFVDFAWLTETTASVTVNLRLSPQVLPIHLMSAVDGVDLNGRPSLGFHFEVNVGTAATPILQPYVQGGYFSVNSAAVQGNYDGAGTAVLGHEVAEWLNDPLGDNSVPAWQEPAFPHICDNPFVEVGDPVEDLSRGIAVTLNGRAYPFPEIVFLPWFTGDRHSTAANGWYSSLNTLSGPATGCPVYTNFGYFGYDFTGATSAVFTGISNSVNNKMKIVGYVAAAQSNPVGLLMDFSFDPATGGPSLGIPQQVLFPGSIVTLPVKVNDAGQVTGFYIDSSGTQHGFLLSKGQYTSIDFPGASATEALAINNWSIPAIAGDYKDALGKVHGFVSIGGQFLPIDAKFAANLSVTGFHDLGLMTGIYDLGGQLGVAQTFGFTGFAGLLSPLNYPNESTAPTATSTILHSLNNRGEVAGTAGIQFPNLLRVNAFLEGGGNFEPLEAGLDDFIAGQAIGINDAGFMVGSFQDPAGVHAAIAVPAQLSTGPAASSSIQVALPFSLK